MGNVKIITDSACDLPINWIQRYEIEVVKISIHDGVNEYIEHETINSDELFKNMVKGTVYKTKQINACDLRKSIEKHIKYKKDVVVMSLSSGITGGYNAACIVRNEMKEKYPDAKLYVCDTFCATSGQALTVLRCAMMAKDGFSFEEIVEAAEFYKVHQEHLWTVTNFDYLVRGGRLSKAKAAVGGMFNIRPVMGLNKRKGVLELVDKVRGEKTLMKVICDYAAKRANGGFNPAQTVIIGYGGNKKLKEALYKEVRERLKVPKENIGCWKMGCIAGSYIGPDYVGFYFLDKLRRDKYDKILLEA